MHVHSDIESSTGACQDLRETLAGILMERGLFREVLPAATSAEDSAALNLDAKIVFLHKVGTASRLLWGKHKGQARVVTQNRLAGEGGRKEIGNFIAEGASSLKGVVPELSGTTHQAVKRVAEQIICVLERDVK